jgi:transposase-like protein
MHNYQTPDPHSLWTEADARRLLERWQQSGDTLAAFARQHGVTISRLHYWRKRLTAAPPVVPPPITLAPAMVISAAPAPVVTVRLPSGSALDVANATPDWVAALVTELARSAS